MKRIFTLILLLASSFITFAQGESRENPIRVTANTSINLLGAADVNTTTWVLVPQEAFATNDLLTVQVGGSNYGDLSFLPSLLPNQTETVFLTSADSRLVKHLWTEEQGDLYIAISQDNAKGTAQFSFSQAKLGEVRQNAIQAQLGENHVPAGAADKAWYVFTSQADTMVYLHTPLVGNILDEDGRNFGAGSQAQNGFRMRPGNTIYFCIMVMGDVSFNITQGAIPEGEYADRPIDITSQSLFTLNIPVDPNATTDGAEQSERYWLYHATQGGLLMWGTDDKVWMEGMWGVSVTDLTSGKRLGTPFTHIQAGMLIYMVNVEAGHDYLISQVIGHAKNSRQVNVYVTFDAGQQGDSRDNPIPVTLNETYDMGRTSATTHYYCFTAPADGVYTATIHAGGQVRATTPQDGTWNIGRDYSIQDRQMHIDDNIPLRAGEVLLLEVTLTSDIDFHVGDADASIPNYSILITKNGEDPSADEKQPGDDLAHAIMAQASQWYDIPQSGAENYRPQFYLIQIPADNHLVITTRHPEAISSPSCISFTLDGQHWNGVNPESTLIPSADGSKKVGRQYTLPATSQDRSLYLYVEGVSFLYEGAQWSYILTPSSNPDALYAPAASSPSGSIYNLQGQQSGAMRGIVIKNGKKLIRNNTQKDR